MTEEELEKAFYLYRAVMKSVEGKSFAEQRDMINRFRCGLLN